MDYGKVIEKIYFELKNTSGRGKVASYIPALAEVNPENYAVSIETLDGESYSIGDFNVSFSIQSISKVFTLAMATNKIGDKLWDYVGREPSGSPFNSLVQLEHEHGIPRNPLINAGALVVTDKIISHYENPKKDILDFVRSVCGNDKINYDKRVADSEYENTYRNMALAYFMKSFGNIENNVEHLIETYCHQCSISMTTRDLAKAFLFFANHGINPFNNKRILSVSQSKRLGALMLTCGFYDESGDFAFRVGMPGKSGVGGGVVAYIPGNLTISVWSPELDVHGNSIIGIETLERFTTDIGNSIF